MKTSGVATATSAEPVVSSVYAAVTATTNEGNDNVPEPPTVRWKVKESSEVRPLMWQFHHRMPAWKLRACIDALQVEPIDLAALAEATGVQFASAELVEVAAKCLDEITKEMAKDESSTSDTTAAAPSCDVEQKRRTRLISKRRSLKFWRTPQRRRIRVTSLLTHVPLHKSRSLRYRHY